MLTFFNDELFQREVVKYRACQYDQMRMLPVNFSLCTTVTIFASYETKICDPELLLLSVFL